jgi:hypothetical protein
MFKVVAGSALGVTDQARPSHDSTRASPLLPSPIDPTATQAVALVHETP